MTNKKLEKRLTFIQYLLHELEHYALAYAEQEPLDTIYFGGGTPSVLHVSDVQRILQHIYDLFDTSRVREISFEINPEDVDEDYLHALHGLGFTRLSIGIQSFYEDDLRFMNRSHTAEQAQDIVPLVRKAGFENFSVDLIFGLPEQPVEYWAANLQRAIKLEVPHLSTYSLTIEEGTVLHKNVQRGLVQPTPDDTMTDRYHFTMDYLREHGYEHYEVSSFAKSGARSEHNQLYWRHANYLGLGPSAHSFWRTSLPRPSAARWANVRNLRRYQALLAQRTLPLDYKEPLTLDELAEEYLLLRLRTSDGLDLHTLEASYGIDLLSEKIEELAWLESEGFIHPIRNDRVRLTDKGFTVCDSITSRLLLGENDWEL